MGGYRRYGWTSPTSPSCSPTSTPPPRQRPRTAPPAPHWTVPLSISTPSTSRRRDAHMAYRAPRGPVLPYPSLIQWGGGPPWKVPRGCRRGTLRRDRGALLASRPGAGGAADGTVHDAGVA